MPYLLIDEIWMQVNLLINRRISFTLMIVILSWVFSLFSYGNVKWSSLFFLNIYILILSNLINDKCSISKLDLERVLKAILLLYFINILIGLCLFLIIGQQDWWVWMFQMSGNRLRGFASEPSYAAFIIITSYYCYTLVTKDDPIQRRKWLAVTIFSIIASTSAYGYLLFSLLLTVSLLKKLKVDMWKFIFAAIVALCVYVFVLLVFFPNSRLAKLIINIMDVFSSGFSISGLSFALFSADSSAFVRTGPLINYFFSWQLFSFHGLFGSGAGSASNYFLEPIKFMVAGDSLNLGFLPAFSYDFGIIYTIIILSLIKQNIMKLPKFTNLIIFAMFLNANFSTQLFCFVIVILSLTNKVILKDEINDHERFNSDV